MISLVNCNSPLRWDGRMLEALFEYANANQAMLLTPFLLMGAMSPVSIPATLALPPLQTQLRHGLLRLPEGRHEEAPARVRRRSWSAPSPIRTLTVGPGF